MKKILAIIGFAILALTAVFFNFDESVTGAPPQNFQTTQLVGSGLDGPTGLGIAPDGRIFILQRDGTVKLYKDNQLLDAPFAVIPSATTGDRGLTGVAFDPDFETNNYVYFYHTLESQIPVNRLVRMDASTDTGTDLTVLYETENPSHQLHIGGTIRFGPDGKIYISVGDNGTPANAQDLTNPHGKILRLNSDGTIPTDNPFYGQANVAEEIWAYGFRNPFRFQFDPESGRMYVGDVGNANVEEVNYVEAGENYGWPTCEGACANPGFTNPIYEYLHEGQNAAVVAGPVYNGEMFPSEYNENLFIGDYAKGFIKSLVLEEHVHPDGEIHIHVEDVIDFDLNAGSVVDLKQAPDGSIYYVTFFPARMYRITYSTDNQIPVPSASSDVTTGLEPLTVNFSSEGTYDPNGDPITYHWDFDDGTDSDEPNPPHTYTDKGTYTVVLTVSDGVNIAQAVPIVIQVGQPPAVTVGWPHDGGTYRAGDTIYYSASALDGAGFDLGDDAFVVEVVFHHDDHTHPFTGYMFGNSGQFTIPTSGESDHNTWYRMYVTATDENGLSDTEIVEIFPEKVDLTFETQPSGLDILLDSSPQSTPSTITHVINYQRELSVPVMQNYNGDPYHFVNWSDGGSAKHNFAVPPVDTTYTAVFEQSPPFVAEYFNNIDLSGDPDLVRNDNFADFDWGTGSPDPVIAPDGFSARWTKDQFFVNGRYVFETNTDDGVRLYVDEELVIDEWSNQSGITHGVTLDLVEGNHEIVMEYFEDSGDASAHLTWRLALDQPGDPVQVNGLKGEYFDTIDFSGVAIERIDPEINFSWGANSPESSLESDTFSVRWTGQVRPELSELYTFYTTTDDGVRLWVDGQLLIDQWIDQSTRQWQGGISLSAGQKYDIVVEYYENGGDAVSILEWSSPSTPKQIVPQDSLFTDGDSVPPQDIYLGQFWNVEAENEPPVFPSRAPDFLNANLHVYFDWGEGSPNPAIANDNFVARWSRQSTFEEGLYRISSTTDDGVRVFVDNELVIDEWIDQSASSYNSDVFIPSGTHTITMEYYERGGLALAQLTVIKVSGTLPTGTGDGLVAKYYNNMDLTDMAVSQTDSEVNFDWGEGSPDPVVEPDTFSARWTGQLEPRHTGIHTFYTQTDDGVRLWIDGELIIDKWQNQSSLEWTGTKYLTSGRKYDIVMEYFENGGGAVAMLKWSTNSIAKQIIPQTQLYSVDIEPTKYQTEYWNTPGSGEQPEIPTTAADLSREDFRIDFDWGYGSPDAVIANDHFVARWTKQTNFSEGMYRFTNTSDDGVRIYVDDYLVLDKWVDQPPTTDTVDYFLTDGDHTVVIEYYENGGGAVAKFDYFRI